MPRSRFIDPSALSPAERIVAASAWLGVVNAMVPWWYRVTDSGGGIQRFNAGVDWTGVVAWIAFGVAALVVLGRAWIWPEPAPHRDGAAYLGLGVVVLVSLSLQSRVLDSASTGFYLGAVLGVGLTVGGILRRKERHSGWR